MIIAQYNEKGGTGKTTISTQLAYSLEDCSIVEADPYGVLDEIIDRVPIYKIGIGDKLPKPKDIKSSNVVYDFGGFEDNRIKDLKADIDLIIIPVLPTIISLDTSIKSYHKVRDLGVPILFVINGAIKEQDVEDTLKYIEENIQEEFDFFVIPFTRAIQTAEAECKSIKEIAEESAFNKHTYRKINKTMKEFVEVVLEYNNI